MWPLSQVAAVPTGPVHASLPLTNQAVGAVNFGRPKINRALIFMNKWAGRNAQ